MTPKSVEDSTTKRLEQEEIKENYSSETVLRQPDLYQASSKSEKCLDNNLLGPVQQDKAKNPKMYQ